MLLAVLMILPTLPCHPSPPTQVTRWPFFDSVSKELVLPTRMSLRREHQALILSAPVTCKGASASGQFKFSLRIQFPSNCHARIEREAHAAVEGLRGSLESSVARAQGEQASPSMTRVSGWFSATDGPPWIPESVQSSLPLPLHLLVFSYSDFLILLKHRQKTPFWPIKTEQTFSFFTIYFICLSCSMWDLRCSACIF